MSRFLYCVPCDLVTSELEARLRKFNTNRCATCGGGLLALEWPSEEEEAPAL